MLKTRRQNSIVSYAGLSRAELFGLAKQAFAQADFDVPERFSAFLPLFPFELIQNMDYAGNSAGGRMAASGFSIDPTEYHRKLYEQMPALYADDNHARNFDYEGRFQGRGVMTVDKAWVMAFPQYQPFLGEKLNIYLIGGGPQAVAVPESIYPRGGGVLKEAERALGITRQAEQFLQYAKNRIAAGEGYQPELFAEEYLALTGLEPVMISQGELGRMLQDLSIAKSLQSDAPAAGLYTESAKRVEHLWQYVPQRYACDTFDVSPVTRHTARLVQPCFQENDYISDFWIPYQDLSEYVSKQRMAVDMARLCEGYQIAPAYDPATGGGRYPDALRAVVVRDREVPMMSGDVLNNPAYGGGMNPLGMIGRQVFIADSRELIRQRKLAPEELELTVENTGVQPQEFRRGLLMAALQESKGKLVDAMYRREAALGQMAEGSRAYEKARQLLDEKVQTMEGQVEQSTKLRHGQVSGYDADIDYLRRRRLQREGGAEEDLREPIAFAVDAQREQSIESGYAMRNNVLRMSYAEAYAPPAAEAPPRAEERAREPEQPARQEASQEAQPKAVEATRPEGQGPAEAPQAKEEQPPQAAMQPEEPAASEEQVAWDEQISSEEPASSQEEAPTEDRAAPEQATDPEQAPEGEETEAQPAPPMPAKPPRQGPVTFESLGHGLKPEEGATSAKLAYIVRRESESPVQILSKDGKMAALLQRKNEKKP